MNFSIESAKSLAIKYLQNGPASSEDITDYCKKNGQIPRDDRAFGSVYSSLSREGLIKKHDICLRRKGHFATGGNVWVLNR